MTDRETIEQRFWGKVWRCGHRHPCKKCCWPWQGIDTTINWQSVWKTHAAFSFHVGDDKVTMPAHRFAYELQSGTLAFRGKKLQICHQCNFGPCCNPTHLAMGSASDNGQDRGQFNRHTASIVLPDGRTWLYQEGCAQEQAYQEALCYQRVFAGAMPANLKYAWALDRPHPYAWPGSPIPKEPASLRSLNAFEVDMIHYEIRGLLLRHRISTEILGTIVASYPGNP